MSKKEAAKEDSHKACRECGNWKEAKERVRLLELLESAINKMQEALTADGFKPTIADYQKLVQMEKDIDEAASDAKEIRVTWVEPTDSESEE
jgi:murein L,D-transpeptidase YcbB/YkuD